MRVGRTAAAVLLGLALCACREEPPLSRPSLVPQALSLASGGLSKEAYAGSVLYGRYCVVCHGESGRGDGFNSGNLPVPPPDLPQRMEAIDPRTLEQHLARGRQPVTGATGCPPYGAQLGDRGTRQLSAYLQTLVGAH